MTPPSTARIYRGTPRNIARLAHVLRAGGLVAVPTETVYGLAANALDPRACRKIFRAKGRPTSDPLIVHIHSADQLELIAEPNDAAWRLARAFWPGALTVVLPKRAIVPDIVSAGLASVAVRMPGHPLFQRLLEAAGVPLAAPSANPFGYVSPTSAEHVRQSLGEKIDYILDGGPCAIGVESTIVDLRDPKSPRLLRPGAVTRSELERVLGRTVYRKRKASDTCSRTAPQIAPGLLARHYSPRTPAILHEEISLAELAATASDEAWVFVAKPQGTNARAKNVFWLDMHGDLRGAARRLFSTLRSVDDGRFTRIHLERARGGELAEAINDRLARAAARG